MESQKISKTQQYRKVMKPMLERKRRARINKCLDQLKNLIIECMKEDDEHILKLEKADILEHTVEYLRKIKINEKRASVIVPKENSDDIKESFRNGYIYAANEVSKILATTRGINTNFGVQLMSHLGYKLNTMTTSPTKPVTISETQETNYSNQKRHHQQHSLFSPITVNVSNPALSPASSGYYSNSSSPIPSDDSSTTDFNLYQYHINKNSSKIYRTTSNKENVWRPW